MLIFSRLSMMAGILCLLGVLGGKFLAPGQVTDRDLVLGIFLALVLILVSGLTDIVNTVGHSHQP